MSNLEKAKETIIRNVIEAVLGVIAQKTLIDIKVIKFDGNTFDYTKDVGVLISIIIELHKIFELNFDLDLNKVEEQFSTISKIIDYFLNRIIDEKILKEK